MGNSYGTPAIKSGLALTLISKVGAGGTRRIQRESYRSQSWTHLRRRSSYEQTVHPQAGDQIGSGFDSDS